MMSLPVISPPILSTGLLLLNALDAVITGPDLFTTSSSPFPRQVISYTASLPSHRTSPFTLFFVTFRLRPQVPFHAPYKRTIFFFGFLQLIGHDDANAPPPGIPLTQLTSSLDLSSSNFWTIFDSPLS